MRKLTAFVKIRRKGINPEQDLRNARLQRNHKSISQIEEKFRHHQNSFFEILVDAIGDKASIVNCNDPKENHGTDYILYNDTFPEVGIDFESGEYYKEWKHTDDLLRLWYRGYSLLARKILGKHSEIIIKSNYTNSSGFALRKSGSLGKNWVYTEANKKGGIVRYNPHDYNRFSNKTPDDSFYEIPHTSIKKILEEHPDCFFLWNNSEINKLVEWLIPYTISLRRIQS